MWVQKEMVSIDSQGLTNQPSHRKAHHVSEKKRVETKSGWWLTYPSEKYEFVNGKDDNPYIMENEIHVWTTEQKS